MQRSRIREALLYKKLNIDHLLPSDSEKNKDEENKVSPPKKTLSTIRNVHVRSKKLPPLCPFYNKRGDLLPDVVASSKVFSRNILQTEVNINTNTNTNSSTIVTSSSLEPKIYRPLLRGGSPLYRDKYNNINFLKNFEINFEEFQKEILYEAKYSTLDYNYSEIFGHKDFYQELSEGLVDEIKILTSEECREFLSDVKLGTDMGIIKELDDSKIKKLWLYTKSANLQKYYGKTFEQEEIDIKRAELVKTIVKS